jgi:ATP adenylyltransferase/5',5'''-P-1,P-4-tetraphosphate phosphorylase II
VRIDWYDVFLRHIPHRIASTTAAVDRESVEKRPCFLCEQNLPLEEEGIAFDSNFSLYCNPFPILDRHLTVVHREHRPQLIEGHVTAMLELARALPGYFVIYNGAACGASAPDHLHFQACSRKLFPIEKDTAAVSGPAVPNYGRRVVVLRDSERGKLEQKLSSLVVALSAVTGVKPEPLINIAAFYEKPVWTAYVFPRGKHRPGVFYTGELTVSPAAIDLCGVLVVPVEKDFERISESDVLSIFDEVTLPEDRFSEVLALMERR